MDSIVPLRPCGDSRRGGGGGGGVQCGLCVMSLRGSAMIEATTKGSPSSPPTALAALATTAGTRAEAVRSSLPVTKGHVWCRVTAVPALGITVGIVRGDGARSSPATRVSARLVMAAICAVRSATRHASEHVSFTNTLRPLPMPSALSMLKSPPKPPTTSRNDTQAPLTNEASFATRHKWSVGPVLKMAE